MKYAELASWEIQFFLFANSENCDGDQKKERNQLKRPQTGDRWHKILRATNLRIF